MQTPGLPTVIEEGMSVGDRLLMVGSEVEIGKIELVVTTRVVDEDDEFFGQEIKMLIPKATFKRW